MMDQKSVIAFLLSFFLPGIGLVYLGETQKGIALFISFIICNLISIYSFFFSILVFVIWAYGMYATYVEVKGM